MKLVYWPIPARAHAARAILHYHDIEFEDIHITADEWKTTKPALADKILYPNLPHLIDGEQYVGESLAIAKYAARKAGLSLSCPKALAFQDQFEGFTGDFLEKIIKLKWMPAGEETDKARADWKSKVCDQLKPIEAHLNKNKWVAGDSLSWVDFYLHTTFVFIFHLVPAAKDNCPSLMKHTNQLLENASYKKFYDSCDFTVMPCDW